MAAFEAFSASTSKKTEKLTCTICLELFRSPRLLPCHHTFCLSCLHDLAARHNNTRFPCPSCRKICPVPQGGVQEFQVNFYIGDDLEEELKAEKRASASSSQPQAQNPWNTRGEARDSFGRQRSNQQKDRSPFSQRYNARSTPNPGRAAQTDTAYDDLFRDGPSGQTERGTADRPQPRVSPIEDDQDYIIQAFICVYSFVCSVVMSVGDVLLCRYLSLMEPFSPLCKMFLTLIVHFCLVSLLGPNITFCAILLGVVAYCKRQM